MFYFLSLFQSAAESEPITKKGRETNGEPRPKLARIAPEANEAGASRVVGTGSFARFARSRFSVDKLDQARVVNCKSLIPPGPALVIRAIEFSDNESHLCRWLK